MEKKEIKRKIKFWKMVLKKLKHQRQTSPGGWHCICGAIDWLDNKWRIRMRLLPHCLPELMKYKPKNGFTISSDGYWWDPRTEEGYSERIKVINNIINDFKIQLKNEK